MKNKFRKRIKKLKQRVTRQGYSWVKFPTCIQIDTNNHCGYDYCGVMCSYCYPQYAIKRGLHEYAEMPLEWIRWIYRNIGVDGKQMYDIRPFLNGDALTEPRLPTILKMSKTYAPWLKTLTFTCGTLTENVGLLLDRNLDAICFTISAHTPSLYFKVHRGRKFENVMKSLKIILAKRLPHQTVEVHCVITKENFAYLQEWWDFFGKFDGLKRVISPLVATYDNLPSKAAMGDLTLEQQEEALVKVADREGYMWTRPLIPYGMPCVLWGNCSFHVSGAFLQCCNWSDYRNWNYGFIQEFIDEGRSLRSVWVERLANRMRNPVCRSCNLKHKDWRERLEKMKIVF